jgi:hypothetical protein
LGKAVKNFPAALLKGPWHVFAKASYFLFEDPDVVLRLRADPQGFLDAVKTPASFKRVGE